MKSLVQSMTVASLLLAMTGCHEYQTAGPQDPGIRKLSMKELFTGSSGFSESDQMQEIQRRGLEAMDTAVGIIRQPTERVSKDSELRRVAVKALQRLKKAHPHQVSKRIQKEIALAKEVYEKTHKHARYNAAMGVGGGRAASIQRSLKNTINNFEQVQRN